MSRQPPHVVVVGAGFSGLLTTLQLLHRDPTVRISLIERSHGFGRGIAYGACEPLHLLNVRAANMSAFPAAPDQFAQWLRGRDGVRAGDGSFVSRRVYGDYLQELLEAGERQGAGGRLKLVHGEATSIAPTARGGAEVVLADGATLVADAVVLALGAAPPALPPLAEPRGLDDLRVIRDPWAPEALARIAPGDSVVLLGAGLTMVDVLSSLARRGHFGSTLALSRHGLLPRRHTSAAMPVGELPPIAASLSRSLRQFRKAVARQPDWRPTFDSLRPVIQSLWGRLTQAERARFVRHLRPYWDSHRHRLAPLVADRLDEALASRRLQVTAGKLVGLEPRRDGLRLLVRPRGSTTEKTISTDWLIACTGPDGDLTQSNSPLLLSSLADGLIRPDPLRLGIDVDPDCRTIDQDGESLRWLSVVGPLTRGAFWESTAIPDLRVQAAEVAERLASELRAAHIAAHAA